LRTFVATSFFIKEFTNFFTLYAIDNYQFFGPLKYFIGQIPQYFFVGNGNAMLPKSFDEKEVITAMNFIAHRPLSEIEGVGMTCPELRSFMNRARHVKSEFTDALLNKMFYSATPRSVMTVEELLSALHGTDFGQGWFHIISEALQASAKPQVVKPAGIHAFSFDNSSPRKSTYLSPRRVAVQNVVDAAQSTKKNPHHLDSAKSETSFPSWSVHTDEHYQDTFDSVRVDRNGVSLADARSQQKDVEKRQRQRIHPNDYGAVVVPRSPRNEGYAVVVVDATAEKERMKRALHRQAELKKLLAQGGASVEKYLRNELSLDDSPREPIHPNDLAYRNTMTAIVDFLAANPKGQATSSASSSPRAVPSPRKAHA
jgi:hypothetical protein